jgi:GDP-L-fucose synthase
MEKILITGCSGLVGTHLVQKCLEQGFKVVGVDIKPFIDLPVTKDFTFYQFDLTKDKVLSDILITEKPNAVLNTFGVKGSPLKAKNQPVDFLYPSFKVNTDLINLCALSNIRLIFISSVGVYAPAEKFIEDSVWKTLPSEADWFPSWSKRLGELLLEAYKIQYDYTNWAILRPANIFGEFDDFSGNGTVISTMCKKIYEAQDNIEVWGDGSPIRDFVYAGDVADAILQLYSSNQNITVNFGAGEEITIKSLVETLIEISNKNLTISWDPTKPNGDLRRQMDTTKQKDLDLMPKTGFKKALKITYEHYKKTRQKL